MLAIFCVRKNLRFVRMSIITKVHSRSFLFLEKCLHDIALQRQIAMTQSTTFIAHKAVPTHNQMHQYELIKASTYDLPLGQVLGFCRSGVSLMIQILDINRTSDDFPLITIEDHLR
jgi:hypothetical protein